MLSAWQQKCCNNEGMLSQMALPPQSGLGLIPTESSQRELGTSSKGRHGSCPTPEPLCAPKSPGKATGMDLFLLPRGSSSRGSQQRCSGASAQVERHLITLPHCLLPQHIPHFPSKMSRAQHNSSPSPAPHLNILLEQLLRSHSQKHSPSRCLGNHRQVAVSEVLTSYKHTKGVTARQAPLLAPSFRIHGQDQHG